MDGAMDWIMSLSNTDAVVLIPRTSYVTVDGNNIFKEVIIVKWC